jgi:hypothetical protein
VFDVYLNGRLAQHSPEESWDQLIANIRQTDEWRAKSRPVVDARTLSGKHLVGYQSWFYTPNDGAHSEWGHWFRGGEPTAENVRVDYWPDTREEFDSELEPTAMTLRDGQRARLFSSYNERTVRRHFDWLADAGLDGVSLGRFLAGTTNHTTRQRLDHSVANVRAAAEASGRVFFVWYDISDHPANMVVANLKNDWAHLIEEEHLFESPNYLWHDGKPLVGIWGAGAGDRVGSPAEWTEMIGFIKNHPNPTYRATLLVSGTRDWRTNPVWSPIFAQADVVSPWPVAAFGGDSDADAYRDTILEPDLTLTRSRGQSYIPIVWPGISAHNRDNHASSLNAAPRRAGSFYWRQVYNSVAAGADNLFTAMYDELDEGTAILKMAATQADVPAQGTFLSLDVDGQPLPSDWYLRLAGAAGKMLRREIPLRATIPIKP